VRRYRQSLMAPVSAQMKAFANAQAGVILSRLGYSDAMISDAKREAWWWFEARRNALARRVPLLAGSAIAWTAAGRAELVPVEVARAGAGEVSVEVLTSIVSTGTERAQYLRLPTTNVSFPFRPGYSAAGRVIAVGPGVPHVRPGEPVAVTGATHASIVTVPGAAVYAIPEGVALEDAALIQLGVISGQGVRLAGLEPGQAVCALGAGLVGSLAQRIALARGSGAVTVIARSRSKEKIAHASGASRLLAVKDDAEAIEQLAAPVVIEATGDPDILELAVGVAAAGGRIVLLGSPRGTSRSLPVDDIRRKRLTLAGAHVETLTYEARMSGVDAHRREGEEFLEALAQGRLAVDDLVDEVVDPREADAFYRDLARGGDLLAARFDWAAVPAEQRVSRGRFWRSPGMSGRGMEYAQKPIRSPVPGRRVAIRESSDPFASARGRLRFGLVGCGDIASFNAAAVAAAPNTELVACFDPVRRLAEDLARTYGGEATPTLEALLERRDVDAVFLSVPHHLHAPLGLQAVEAGKHLIVEKPAANTLADAAELSAGAERAGVLLSVCFPHRYEPNVVAARKLVAAGAVGDVAGTLTSFFADKPLSYWLGGFTGRSTSNWRLSRSQAGGGVLIMNLSHYLDLVRYITGVEAETCAALTDVVDGPAEVEDTVSLSVRYTNGAMGTLFGCSALRGNRSGFVELHVWGRDGHLTVEPKPQVYTARAIDGLRPARWQTFGGSASADIRAVFVSRFATAIDRGDEPDVTAADGLAVQALIEAAYRSSEAGAPVRVDDLLAEVGR
jgi:2-desacetyl-2-hydroxyethyl bacteriochlorophyllide A dehydrogenase